MCRKTGLDAGHSTPSLYTIHYYLSSDIKVSKTQKVLRKTFIFPKQKIYHYIRKTLLNSRDDV